LTLGRYGLDIARMGTDKSVLYRNRGGRIRLVKAWAKADTMQSAGVAAQILRSHAPNRVPATVDIIGLGAGVFDRLREQKLPVAPHQGSERALNFKKFKNRRSEVYWTFRELMDEGLIDLDPEDETLLGQLGSLKWGVGSDGRTFVETKDDMRERGLPSPDHADAAVLSTVAPASVMGNPKGERAKANSITGDLIKKVM
jgi:phage terminase large subunit